MITWDQIVAECDGYRAGFVAVFRKYEGEPTDKTDAQGRPLKVSRATFAEYVLGISAESFRRWVLQAEAAAVGTTWRRPGHEGGAARTGQMARQAIKSDSVPVEDKVGMLTDLISDPKVLKAYREQRPKTSESDAKAAKAAVSAFTETLGNAASGLEVPMWRDQLKALARWLAEWDLAEEDVRAIRRDWSKVGDELDVQEFRLGLGVEV